MNEYIRILEDLAEKARDLATALQNQGGAAPTTIPAQDLHNMRVLLANQLGRYPHEPHLPQA